MSKAKESTITAAIMRELIRRGYVTLKIHGGPYQAAGIPDVLACKDGKAVWVEVKRPGETPTKIQEHMIAKLRDAGCVVIVATCVDDLTKGLPCHSPN